MTVVVDLWHFNLPLWWRSEAWKPLFVMTSHEIYRATKNTTTLAFSDKCVVRKHCAGETLCSEKDIEWSEENETHTQLRRLAQLRVVTSFHRDHEDRDDMVVTCFRKEDGKYETKILDLFDVENLHVFLRAMTRKFTGLWVTVTVVAVTHNLFI